MKESLGKILGQLHLIIALYALWSLYSMYDTHAIALAQIEEQFPGIQAEIDEAEKKLSQIEEFRKNLEASRVRVTEVFNSIGQVQKQLPPEVNDIEVLDFFSKEAKSLNIPEIESTPNPEQAMGFYVSKPYKIIARGTFLQFVVFLERIDAAERLFNVNNVIIKADEEDQKTRFRVVNMEVELQTFKYNSRHTETSGVESIGVEAETPKPRRRKRDKGDQP